MRVGAFSHDLSRQALNATASRDPDTGKACPVLKFPGLLLSWGGRWNGMTASEILPPHDYRNEGKRWCGLVPGLILFRLVTPPLQQIVVGSYPVRDVWFSSHLLLEVIGRIQNFGS
jgi:hypothetical protein